MSICVTCDINEKVKQLNAMLSAIDGTYQELLKAKGVSDSEYIVMFAINELGEGCLQKDISDNSNVSKKTINSTIKKFQKEGLIELKLGKYPNMHIHLTDDGRKYMEEKILPILEVENDIVSGMTDDEFQFLTDCFHKYIGNFRLHVMKFIGNIK